MAVFAWKFDILRVMKKYGVMCVLMVALGCGKAYAYHAALNDAVGEFLKGNYGTAMTASFQTQSRADSALRAEAMHLQAMCLIQQKDNGQAREILKQALQMARGQMLFEIYMAIGDTYFNQEMYAQAGSLYDQLISQKGTADYGAQLYYKAGKAYQKNGEWAKSTRYFDLLRKQYPQSFEARLSELTAVDGNYFTVQVGSFANRQNAQKLHDDLRAKGYEAYMTPLQSAGRTLYRVRVGKFASRQSAQLTEQQLRTKETLPTKMFP